MFLRRGRQRARRPTWDRAVTLVTTHYTTVLPEWNGGMFWWSEAEVVPAARVELKFVKANPSDEGMSEPS